MKDRRLCVECGQIKNHQDHTYHHDYVKPGAPGISPVGQRMTRFNASDAGKEYRARTEEIQKGGTPCQILSPVCTGMAEHQHEDKARGKAGGIDASIRKGTRFFPACDPCNGYVSDNQVWARERGFIVRARDIDLEQRNDNQV